MSEKGVEVLTKELKDLQYTLAELTVENETLRARVKKLATRTPQWPKGYKPYNRKYDGQKQGNWKNKTNGRNPH